jgi:hypothetical protein
VDFVWEACGQSYSLVIPGLGMMNPSGHFVKL